MDRSALQMRVYRFGLFQLDPGSNGELLRQGVPIKLQDQPFRVLCLLVKRPGEIITREELRQALWPDGTYVEFDGSLNATLKRLRSALGDPADNPVFIETIPKRGYRFIAPVECLPAPSGRDAEFTAALGTRVQLCGRTADMDGPLRLWFLCWPLQLSASGPGPARFISHRHSLLGLSLFFPSGMNKPVPTWTSWVLPSQTIS